MLYQAVVKELEVLPNVGLVVSLYFVQDCTIYVTKGGIKPFHNSLPRSLSRLVIAKSGVGVPRSPTKSPSLRPPLKPGNIIQSFILSK